MGFHYDWNSLCHVTLLNFESITVAREMELHGGLSQIESTSEAGAHVNYLDRWLLYNKAGMELMLEEQP